MSAIVGYGQLGRKELGSSYIKKMVKRMNHWGADRIESWEGDHAAMGFLLLQNSPQSFFEKQPLVDEISGLSIVADATLFNREELKRKIDLIGEELADSFLILRAYQKWGKECPSYLNGSFAFSIWDENQRQFFCARDHHGIKPFYYHYDQQKFAFASEIKGLMELPFISKEIDEQWVADYLCRIWLDKKSTLYKDVKRLEPAQAMVVNENGIQFHSYWDLESVQDTRFKTELEYIEAFREKLESAVNRRLESKYEIASELSGGLDSSTVTAISKRNSKDKLLHPYSLILPKTGVYKNLHDEKEWIGIICEHLEINNNSRLTGENIGMRPAFDWNQKIHDEPPKEMNCLFRDILYQEIQAKNIRVLLSGFGGDEMVSQHTSGYLSGLMQNGEWRQLWKEMKATSSEKERSMLRVISGLGLKAAFNHNSARINQFLRVYAGRSAPLRNKLAHRPLKSNLYKKFDIENRFEAYQALFFDTGKFIPDQIRRMQQPQVMYRLEACDIATRSFKIEYRYPLLDIDLIEFYLSLPIQMKAQQGKGRYIFRKAMESYLPSSIVWRSSKKGSSNPQAVVRSRVDGENIRQQLMNIPQNHPIHLLADFQKETNLIKDANRKNKIWHKSTTDFMNLLLADKMQPLKA